MKYWIISLKIQYTFFIGSHVYRENHWNTNTQCSSRSYWRVCPSTSKRGIIHKRKSKRQRWTGVELRFPWKFQCDCWFWHWSVSSYLVLWSRLFKLRYRSSFPPKKFRIQQVKQRSRQMLEQSPQSNFTAI